MKFYAGDCIIKYGFENMDFLKVTGMLADAFWSRDIKRQQYRLSREVRLLRCACSEARSCVMCRSMVRAMTLALNPRR